MAIIVLICLDVTSFNDIFHFHGFTCSCCGLKGVVLRGGFILWFVVLMLVMRGGVFILWFEGGDAGL